MANIVVTFSADGDLRGPILKVLDHVARVIFLSEVSAEDRSQELASADVLISWHPARELQPAEFGMISHAKLMQLLSAGADHLPFLQLPAALTIAGNAGAYAAPMAEHIMAMTLAVMKNILDRHNKLKNGIFDQTKPSRMLKGSTCAILGFGGIGKATARLLRCFDVKIYAINSTGKTDEPVEFIGTLKNLEYVFRQADVVVVALPLTNSTRGLIGRRELGWMKDSAILVNVARGDIINEAALYEKLKSDPNFTAAIDAWWNEPLFHGTFGTSHPFLELPNFLGSPHNSGLVPGSLRTGAAYAAENVKRFLNHEPVVGIVKRSDYT